MSALCVLAAVAMGIPLALIVTPLLYGGGLIAADIINLFWPIPPAFWQQANEVASFGLVALNWLLQHTAADPRALAFGAMVMLLPGTLLSIFLWMGISTMFRHGGVGGALLALKAREPNQAELRELQLADVVQEMAIAAGLPAPRIMLVDAPGANAAAIGTSPADARIVVSRRLLDELNREELEAVLAHLIGSIGNGDLHIAFRVIAIFESCGLLVALVNAPFGSQSRRALWHILRYGIRGPAKYGGTAEAAAVADLLTRNVGLDTDDIDRFFDATKRSALRSIRNFLFFPIFFTNAAIKLWLWFFSLTVLGPSMALLWRTRRYLADAFAVQLTRDPDSLAAALKKLQDDGGAISGGGWASHLFIVSPGRGGHAAADAPSGQQMQALAQAWVATGQPGGGPVSAVDPANFPALTGEFTGTVRAAFAGDAQAMARIREFKEAMAGADPALAAHIPDIADLAAARTGDRTAIARLRAFREHAVSGTENRKAEADDSAQSSDPSSVSFLGFHPSVDRRLKRLARMGAHLDLPAGDHKQWIVAFVLSVIFAPFLVLLIGLFLLLIAIMTMASLTFLVVWLAVIHKVFMLVAHQ